MIKQGILASTVLVAIATISAFRFFDAQTTSNAPAAPSAGAPVVTSVDTQHNLNTFLNKDISNEDSAVLLRAHLVSQFDRTATTPSPRYWHSEWDTRFVEKQEFLIARDDYVRSELVLAFGPEVEQFDALRDLFFPFADEMSMLSSVDQLQLKKWDLEQVSRFDRQMERKTSSLIGKPTIDSGQSITMPRDEYSALRSAISEDAVFEYGVRNSGIARHLRSFASDLNESDFRDAYRLLMQGITANRVDYDRELEKIIGRRNFLAWSASVRPSFAAIKSAADQLNLSEDETFAVIDIIDEANSLAFEKLRASGAERRLHSGIGSQIMAERQARIESLVGEEAAHTLLAALNRYYIEKNRATR